MLYHPSAQVAIRNYVLRNILLCVLLIVCGIVAEFTLSIPHSGLFGFLGGLFFIFDGVSILLKYQSNKLSVVDAVIVSAESSKNIIRRTITTYRAIPIDEDGKFCDRNGKYDFFIEIDTTKHRFGQMLNVGATYRFVFNTTDEEANYSANTLLIKQRGSANAEREEVTEPPIADPAAENNSVK